MDVTITEIPPETLNALRSLARKKGKTLEEYARSVLEQATKNTSEMDEEYQNLIEQDLAELEESELKHLEKEFEAVKSNHSLFIYEINN